MGKEKKEIGMEKLIELLNEYDTEIMKSETRPRATYKGKLSCCWYDMHEVSSDLLGYLIISKQFRFIKWLVENDKIDLRKLSYKNLYMSDYGSSDDIFLAYDKGEQGIIYIVDYYETLLMLLSISDAPIEDLISYLK